MGTEPGERARRRPDGRLDYRPAVGDLIVLRTPHVCGSDRMAVTGVGLDVRLSCAGCGSRLTLSRERLRGRVRGLLGGVDAAGG
jgi:hypothetical protein